MSTMHCANASLQAEPESPSKDDRHFVRVVIDRLRQSQSLSQQEAQRMMELILQAKFTVDEMESYLRAMAAKETTVGELVGSVCALRAATQPVETGMQVLDTCGTGGDGLGTFNISTTAALLVAATGQPVAKHGNRSSCGATGSADVLESLGIPLGRSGNYVIDSLRRHRFAFLFAPSFRPKVEGLVEARRRIKGPTLFNLAGPLCNPANPPFQVIGTYSGAAARTLAEAALQLGTQRTFIVTGPQGIDELMFSDGNIILQVQEGELTLQELETADCGSPKCTLNDLAGGDASQNAAAIESIFSDQRGPKRDVVVLNAGLALLAAGRAGDIKDGCEQCSTAIDDGRARQLLRALRSPANA